MVDTDLTAEEYLRAIQALGSLVNAKKLNPPARMRVLTRIRTHDLKWVPIVGALAIFGVSLRTGRRYVDEGVIPQPVGFYMGRQFFQVDALRANAAYYAQARRRGDRVATIGRVLRSG